MIAIPEVPLFVSVYLVPWIAFYALGAGSALTGIAIILVQLAFTMYLMWDFQKQLGRVVQIRYQLWLPHGQGTGFGDEFRDECDARGLVAQIETWERWPMLTAVVQGIGRDIVDFSVWIKRQEGKAGRITGALVPPDEHKSLKATTLARHPGSCNQYHKLEDL